MIIKIKQPQAIWDKGQRGNQEDTIFPAIGRATAADRLFIVCDGMGGHEHGEVASGEFTKGLADFFARHANPDTPLTDDLLKEAIAYAYQQLDKVDDGNYKKMGTTLTLIYIHRGGVTAAHIGDSRIYHVRPGKENLYVSRDHSLVFDLYQSGEISFEEMKTYKHKNIITRAVQPGEDNRTHPDIIHITDIEKGDYFYLCSDGMIEQMDDDEILRLLSSSDSNEAKCQQLIDATVGNSDNHSAYLIQVEDVQREPADDLITENEEKTARCNALNIKPMAAHDPNEGVVMAQDITVSAQPQPVAEYPVVEATAVEPVPNASTRGTGRRSVISRLWPLLLIALAAAAVAIYLTLGNRNKKDVDAEQQEVTIPIRPVKPPLPSNAKPEPKNNIERHIQQLEQEQEQKQRQEPRQSTDNKKVGPAQVDQSGNNEEQTQQPGKQQTAPNIKNGVKKQGTRLQPNRQNPDTLSA